MDNKSVTIEAVDNGFVIRFWQSGEQATSLSQDIAGALAVATDYLNRQAVPRDVGQLNAGISATTTNATNL